MPIFNLYKKGDPKARQNSSILGSIEDSGRAVGKPALDRASDSMEELVKLQRLVNTPLG